MPSASPARTATGSVGSWRSSAPWGSTRRAPCPSSARSSASTDAPGYPAPELDPAAFLEETLTRLVEWLAALGRRGPHLLVVEDLHWADPSTLDLLGRLVERPPPGILTLATTRDASPIAWTAVRLGRRSSADSTTSAAARLVENVAAGKDLPEDRRATVLRVAEGVPLFVEELTRSSLDPSRDGSMPLRLQELFTWRLKAPDVDLRVVQVAATLGPTFDAATVTDVVGDLAAVTEQLRVLADHGIVEPIGPTGTYRFRHALMRDAAYETQVLDVRRETHARVGEVLARHGAEPALVAQHLDVAGRGRARRRPVPGGRTARAGTRRAPRGHPPAVPGDRPARRSSPPRTTATSASSPRACCAG